MLEANAWRSCLVTWAPPSVSGALLTLTSVATPRASLPAAGLLALSLLWAARSTERRHRRERAEAERRQAGALARADLIASVSHEVRTPLTMIKASADLLEEGTPGPLTTQQRVFLTTIQQQCRQVIDIAEDLLVQARIDSGSMRLDRQVVDVAELVRNTARAIRPVFDQRHQRITVRTPQRARVPADRRLIIQVVTNLLTNGGRHTTHGGHVIVRVLDNETAVAVSVTDDGAGMSREERARLFERFMTGGAGGEGTGLGLAISKRIVELHGGRILVDTRLRHGTTVMFTLPKGAPT